MRLPVLLFCVLCSTVAALPAFAQPSLLQSGPMVGYADMREVALWVQTTAPARARFVYWDTAMPQQRYTTEEMATAKEKAYTALLIADSVQPGKVYNYEVQLNGTTIPRPYPLRFRTPALWQWRTEPPTLRVALGSCAYINEPEYDRPGTPYGSDYQIFTAIADTKPDLMLWLGDNTYLREADWNTRTGVLHRYTHTRSLAQMQPMLAAMSNYAIWDDHDFGPNNSDRGFWNRDNTLEAFKLFWANPSYGVGGQPGVTTQFSWSDVDFFLLDNRYYRSPDDRTTGERTILGKEQLQWLIDALRSSWATFKVVAIGGQVVNPAAIYETYATFPEERNQLLELLAKENIPGIVFIDGDRHHTVLSKMPRESAYPLYDLTVSPLTSGAGRNVATEGNTFAIPETIVEQRNFGIMEFSGPRKERVLTITIYDSNGKELWKRSIKAGEVR